MKRHLVIVFFYALYSCFLYGTYSWYEYDLDQFILFAIGAMFMGWIFNLAPQIRIRFLLWTLVFGIGFCICVFQASFAPGKIFSEYDFRRQLTMGYRHKRNISVRNYSITRKRKIEERKQYNERMKKIRETSGSSGSSYSGGSSHYGGGLSGGK